MIEGDINETYVKNGVAYALANNNLVEVGKLPYYSQAMDKLGMYDGFRENLVIAKRRFLENIFRGNKLCYGNKAYLKFKQGIYANIIYLDFHSYYATIFSQIANHINEQYQGKEIKGIVKRAYFIKSVKNISKKASSAPLVDIKDIAKNSVKIDTNDKEPLIRLIKDIDNSIFYDKADKSTSKTTRNALAYGFGYQQKIARISNISALTMFFANRIMGLSIDYFEKRNDNKVIFSHTDSFMTDHFYTKDLDDAIKQACSTLNEEYFGGVPILHFDISNISIKGKFNELMIINQNSYIYSSKGDKGKDDVGLAIGGLSTQKKNWGGISKNGENVADILSENTEALFKGEKEFFNKYEDIEFIYSPLQYRLTEEYKNKIIDDFSKDIPQNRLIIISKTIKHLGELVSPIIASNININV